MIIAPSKILASPRKRYTRVERQLQGLRECPPKRSRAPTRREKLGGFRPPQSDPSALPNTVRHLRQEGRRSSARLLRYREVRPLNARLDSP